MRPRVLIYAALLLVLVTGLSVSLSQRVPLRAELIRDRNALYRELPDGRFENIYTLKLINMDRVPHRYTVTVDGNEAVTATPNRPLRLDPEQVGTFSLSLAAPASAGQGVQRLEVQFTAEGEPSIMRRTRARLILPTEGPQ